MWCGAMTLLTVINNRTSISDKLQIPVYHPGYESLETLIPAAFAKKELRSISCLRNYITACLFNYNAM
jgi:hypothetical protein